MYRVYQDEKPADTEGYPSLDESWSPELNNHPSRKEAIVYAYMYAYPYTREMAEVAFDTSPDDFLCQPTDMSMGAVPVIMEIRKTESR